MASSHQDRAGLARAPKHCPASPDVVRRARAFSRDSSLSHCTPLSFGRGVAFRLQRARQPASIVGRARVVLRSPIHLLHLDISRSQRHLSTGDFHRADKNFHATHNVHER